MDAYTLCRWSAWYRLDYVQTDRVLILLNAPLNKNHASFTPTPD